MEKWGKRAERATTGSVRASNRSALCLRPRRRGPDHFCEPGLFMPLECKGPCVRDLRL